MDEPVDLWDSLRDSIGALNRGGQRLSHGRNSIANSYLQETYQMAKSKSVFGIYLKKAQRRPKVRQSGLARVRQLEVSWVGSSASARWRFRASDPSSQQDRLLRPSRELE